jgi:hypothetical protein
VLIIDDLLTAPFKGLLWVFGKIHKAAVEEIEGQSERITTELRELYMQLDTGKITEEEFDTREQELLDRLDKLDELKKGPEEEDEELEEEESEEEE